MVVKWRESIGKGWDESSKSEQEMEEEMRV